MSQPGGRAAGRGRGRGSGGTGASTGRGRGTASAGRGTRPSAVASQAAAAPQQRQPAAAAPQQWQPAAAAAPPAAAPVRQAEPPSVGAITRQMAATQIAAAAVPAPVPVGTGEAMAPDGARQDRGRRGVSILPEAENFVPPVHEALEKRRGTTALSMPINVVANSFLLELGHDGPSRDAVYNYRVTCDTNLAQSVLAGVIHNTDSITAVVGKIAFDGAQAFLLNRLEDDETSFTVMTRGSKDGTIPPEQITITFKFNHRVPWGSPTILQVMNILLKSYMKKSGMTLIGRHYFQPNRVKSVQGLDGINVWPGYVTAISECTGGVMLNVDIAHKITRSQSAFHVISDAKRGGGNVKENAEKVLVGEVVMTGYNNKTYRVDDIDWDVTPLHTFKAGRKSGKEFEEYETTYVDYYRERYQLTLKTTDQPMLVSRNKDKGPIPANNPEAEHQAQRLIYLVPELCNLTGITERQRADFNFMKELGKVTRIGPNDRAKLTMEYPRDMNSRKELHRFDNWSVKINTGFVKPTARRLKPVGMYQFVDWAKKTRGGELKSNPDNPDWTNSIRSMKLARVPAEGLKSWLFIFPERVSREAQDFHNTFIKVAGPMGLKVDNAELQRIPRDTPAMYQDAIMAKLNSGVRYQLLACMLPNNQKQRYDIIKKISYCGQKPIPSQCVISKTVSGKKLMSACTKIAMQINAKLGGALWHPEPLGSFAGTMTIGLDVFHQKGQNSIVGYVASLNQTQDRFYSRALIQTERGENMIKLQEPTQVALQRFKELNGQFPKHICVFRDGVGDGQLPLVRNSECRQITEAVKTVVGPDHKVGLIFVVVQKRVNYRFYVTNNGANFANPMPGTVVDDVVTRKKWFDYYLCSQSVNQGTVSPTHFNVIFDDCNNGDGIKPDDIQRYSYIQTHMYYNWPGTVRVPAQCQYAHKLAYLVGEHTVSIPSDLLADRLYYL